MQKQDRSVKGALENLIGTSGASIELEVLRKAIDKIMDDDTAKSTIRIKEVIREELSNLTDRYPERYFVWNGRFVEGFEDEDSALSF